MRVRTRSTSSYRAGWWYRQCASATTMWQSSSISMRLYSMPIARISSTRPTSNHTKKFAWYTTPIWSVSAYRTRSVTSWYSIIELSVFAFPDGFALFEKRRQPFLEVRRTADSRVFEHRALQVGVDSRGFRRGQKSFRARHAARTRRHQHVAQFAPAPSAFRAPRFHSPAPSLSLPALRRAARSAAGLAPVCHRSAASETPKQSREEIRFLLPCTRISLREQRA